MERTPAQWSGEDRERAADYMASLDVTDKAFTEYQKAIRRAKGGKHVGSDIAATANDTEEKWKRAKEEVSKSERALGSLAGDMVEMRVGTKRGRAELREALRTLEHQGGGLAAEIGPAITVVSEQETLPFARNVQEATPQHEGVIRRLATSRFGKAFYALGVLIGLTDKAAGSIERFQNLEQQREQAHESLYELTSQTAVEYGRSHGAISFDNLPSPDDVITFEDGGEVSRSEFIGKINTWYTKLIIDNHGPMRLMRDACETTLPNGDTGLDAITCNAIYGDQVTLDAKALSVLAEVHGYTAEELQTHSKIIRDSVMQRPSGIVLPGSTLGMVHYDYGSVPENMKVQREEIYERYYDDASMLAFSAIRTLDIEPTDSASIKAVQDTIKAKIELENVMLLIASDIMNLNNGYIAQALTQGLTNAQTGENFVPHIEKLYGAMEKTDLAWKVLAAHEGQDGVLHDLSQSMHEVYFSKVDGILRAGRDTGYETPFFLAQLTALDGEQPRRI